MPNYRFVFFFSFGAIGDFLMTLSAAEKIHMGDPTARIVVFARRNASLLREFAVAYPFVEVIASPWRIFFCFACSLFAKTLAVIPPSFGPLPAKIFLFSRAITLFPGSHIAELSFAQRKFPRTDIFFSFDLSRSMCANMYAFFEMVGYPATGTPSFSFSTDAGIWSRLGVDRGAYIVVHPFAANPKRSFPEKRWATILDTLTEQFPSRNIILTGSKDDRVFAEAILTEARVARPIVACGMLRIRELATILSGAVVYIGVDSGITHLAAMLSIPSVIVGNRSNPVWLPTYNPNATILTNAEHCTCDGAKGGDCVVLFEGKAYYRCMLEVANDDIIKALREKIEGKIAHDTGESI